MLTCKSLFGLGYRGERLIEPFCYNFSVAWWLRVRLKIRASHFQSSWRDWSNGKTVKLRGHVVKPMIGLPRGDFMQHSRSNLGVS